MSNPGLRRIRPICQRSLDHDRCSAGAACIETWRRDDRIDLLPNNQFPALGLSYTGAKTIISPVNSSVAQGDGGTPPHFSTTRWSLILNSTAAETGDQKARQALSELCRLYWRPIFSFVCRRGYSPEDAQDLTQDFFVMILEGHWLKNADRNRGRFRSLLLKSLQNFLNDAVEKKRAHKRGGEVKFVSWDDWMAEAPSHLTVSRRALKSWPAERLFDLRWAATVVEHAIGKLREECQHQGRLRAFESLRPCLGAEREDVSYPALSKLLGVTEIEVKRLVHRFRQRYRTLLRDSVAQTVADPAEVDDEIRYLCRILAADAAAEP